MQIHLSRRPLLLTLLFWSLCLLGTSAGAQLAPNGSVSGALSAAHTSDTYTFTATADGDAAFSLALSAGLRGYIQFYDSNGTSLLYQSSVPGFGGTATQNVPHLAPGATYYVVAVRYDGSGTYTLSNTYTKQAVVIDTEPNDDTGHALSVGMPATRTGHLGYSRTAYNDIDNVDTYAITVPKDCDLHLEMALTSTLRGYIQVYDSNGVNLIYQSSIPGFGGTATQDVPHLAPGATYYVVAVRYDGYGGYTLKGTISASTIAIDPEPNDDVAHALKVAMPATRTGHLGYSRTAYNDVDTTDVYAFTAPNDGDLRLKLTLDPDLPLRAYIQVYDSNGTNLIYQSGIPGAQGNVTQDVPHLAAGTTYYAVIVRYNGYGGYTLAGTFAAQSIVNDKEINDTAAKALPVAMPATRTGHLGYSRTTYSDLDNTDVYAITVPKDCDVSLKMTLTATLRAWIRFYDVDGATLVSETGIPGAGGNVTLNVPHLAPGKTYYVVAQRYDGYGGYTLVGTISDPGIANDTEPNNDAASALPMVLNTTQSGHLGYSRASYSDVDPWDVYAVTVPHDGDINLTLTLGATLRAWIRFYDSNGSNLLLETGIPGAGGNVSLNLPHLGSGSTYYVVVQRYDGYGGYRLENRYRPQYVTNDPEVNDAFAQAITASSLDGVTGHLGYSRTAFNDLDGDDCYKITHGGGTLSVSLLNSANLRAYIRLFDLNGNLLNETGIPGAGGSVTLSVNRSAGSYYLVIQRYSGYGAYGLNAQPTISVSGHVDLEGWEGAPYPITLVLHPLDGSADTVQQLTNGDYSLQGLPRKDYTISFKGAKWLRRTEILDSHLGNVFFVDATLSPGDLNDDNAVDLDDLTTFFDAYGSVDGDGNYNELADLNGDAQVELTDLVLFFSHYGETGD